MNNSQQRIHIRPAFPKDAPALLAIYAPYVEQTAITFEYTVPTIREFTARIAHTLEQYPYLVAESDGTILGYAYAGSFHDRPAYDWSVETSIYVAMDHKASGIGRKLYDALEAALKAQGILNLYACIACPDGDHDEYLSRDSISFHNKMGYRFVGEFRQCGYKFGRWYHMVWMEKFIGEHSEPQPPVKRFADVQDGLNFS